MLDRMERGVRLEGENVRRTSVYDTTVVDVLNSLHNGSYKLCSIAFGQSAR